MSHKKNFYFLKILDKINNIFIKKNIYRLKIEINHNYSGRNYGVV